MCNTAQLGTGPGDKAMSLMWYNFFFRLVCWLHLKLITSGHDICTSTQNGSKLEVLPKKILIHVLEWISTPVFPMFVQGSHIIFEMFYTHVLHERAPHTHMNLTTFT